MVDTTVIFAGTRSIDVTLTGAGVVYYDLYINNSYFNTIKVDFS